MGSVVAPGLVWSNERGSMVIRKSISRKAVEALAKLVAKDFSRPALAHIALQAGWAEVADGWSAMRVYGSGGPDDDHGTVLLPGKAAAALVRAANIDRLHVEDTGKELVLSNPAATASRIEDRCDGVFPNTESLYVDHDGLPSVTVDAYKLRAICDAFIEADRDRLYDRRSGRSTPLQIFLREGPDPVLFRVETGWSIGGGDRLAEALLMPMHIQVSEKKSGGAAGTGSGS